MTSFQDAYGQLENKFKTAADTEGSVYIPNIPPPSHARYVFAAMEPSLGRWGINPTQRVAYLRNGMTNFAWSMGDFALHYCARTYLCNPGESYHITDLSKGAMLVAQASRDRQQRWLRWLPLLQRELSVVAAPGARIFAVGRQVEAFLHANAPELEVDYVIHYSGTAVRHHLALANRMPAEFATFSATIRPADFLEVCQEVLAECTRMTPEFRGQRIASFRDGVLRNGFTRSALALMFSYCASFKSLNGP